MPERIHLRRAKGWRKPESAITVARPSSWGNPFRLGAAVHRHSLFFTEPWQRLFRSLYPIGGVVFDGDRAPITGREVREYHREISGVDHRGRRYNALDPDVFFWAHATFVMGMVKTHERLGYPLSPREKEQAWAEGLRWYSMYGMPMRELPQDWTAFQRYWDDMCAHVLEDNQATRDVLTEWTGRLRAEAGDRFPEKVTAFHPQMAVHGRYGKPCPRCGAKVQRIRYASNETDYCPHCQTAGKLLADRSLSRLLRQDWPRTPEELEERRRA